MQSTAFCLLFLFVFSAVPLTAFSDEPLFPYEDHTTQLWGYRNSTGRVRISPQFLVAEEYSPLGIAAVADASGWKYIDSKGKTLIRPFVFDNGPDPFQEGLARFKEGRKFGFFDERIRVVIPPRFDFAAPFSEGLAGFCEGCQENPQEEHTSYEGGFWGFIDKSGRIVIPPKFEEVHSFEQGRAWVKLHGSWILIDKEGDIVQ